MLNILKNWKNQHSAASNMECYTKENILKGEIPEHIAIIMDGNGRWAKKRAMPRIAGHHEGMKVVRQTTKLANELGVKALTLYAFSTENWKRPKFEVDFLMKLPEEFLGTYLPELVEENVRVRLTGDREGLPPHTIRAVEKAIRDTENNDGLILNFALNYGDVQKSSEPQRELPKKRKRHIEYRGNRRKAIFRLFNDRSFAGP